jgi:hypothetical protein
VFLIALTKVGQALAQTGAVAGGATALGVALGLAGGTLAAEAGFKVDRWTVATNGGSTGAFIGVFIVVGELLS